MVRDELFQSSLDQLEYYRVLEHIAGFAASSLGVEHIHALMPMSDEDTIRRDLSMVSEMRNMIQRGDELPLHGVYDIRNALAVSRITGSYLGGEDLLSILTTLQSLRKVREFFDAGVRLVWLIDPPKRTARVFSTPDQSDLLREDQELDGGDVLPGFSVSLAELFRHIPPPRKR